MFPDQVIIDAMHVPYVDAYWTEQEEREQGPPMQAELADITEPGPPDELLALGKKWLQRITDHWHVSAHTVFTIAGWGDDPARLYLLFMACLGHGIGLEDDQEDAETLALVGRLVHHNLSDVPYFCGGELDDIVYSVLGDRFIRYYKCECGVTWDDEFISGDCCPECDTKCEPHDSEQAA
jgi:hypothetical protein